MARLLHYASMLCCAFVVVSFALFAHAQLSHASNQQVASLNGVTASGPVAHRPGQPRRFIDTVAGKLESPFTELVRSDNAWVRHLIPLLAALLVYGGGIGYLARWSSARAT
jgi:hypothetical protein